MTTLRLFFSLYHYLPSYLLESKMQKSLCTFLVFFFCFAQSAFGITYWWRSAPMDNVWTNPNNWSTVGFFSTINGGTFPGPADVATFGLLAETTAPITFVGIPLAGVGAINAATLQRVITIPAGEVLTIVGTGSNAGGNANITIAAGATMRILGGATVDGAGGAFRWNIAGTLEIVNNGAVNSSGMGFYPGSTLLYTGAGAKTVGWELNDGSTNMPYAGGFPGNIVVNKPPGTNLVFPNNAVIAGSTTFSGGKINDGVIQNLTFNGNFTMSGAAFGDTRLILWGGSNVTFNGATNTVSGGEIWNAGNVVINQPLALSGGQIAMMGTGSGVGGPGTVSGSSTVSYTAAASLSYNAAWAATTGKELPAIMNGIINSGGASVNVTMGGNTQINGTLNLTGGGIWNTGAFTLTINSASATNAGGLNIQNSGRVIITNTQTLVNSGTLTVNNGGTFELQGNAAITTNAPTYVVGSTLLYSGAGARNTALELPPAPTDMVGNIAINKPAAADITLTTNLNLASALTFSGGAHLVLPASVGRFLRLRNGSSISTPSTGRVSCNTGTEVIVESATINGNNFLGNFIVDLTLNRATDIQMLGNISLGSTLQKLMAGRLDLNGNQFDITGSAAINGSINPGGIVANGAASTILYRLAATPLNGNWFAGNQITNLTIGTGVAATMNSTINVLNAGSIPAGSSLAVNGSALLAVANSSTFTNSGTLSVQAMGTLEMQGGATYTGTAPSYAATTSVLTYTGAAFKNIGAEWAATMNGSVIINKGVGNQLGLPSPPTRTQNGTLTISTGLLTISGAGNLALNAAAPVHSVQNTADLRIADGGTVTGLGNITINAGGTLSLYYNGSTIPARTGVPNFLANGILLYGGVSGFTTGSEFPNTMPGAVSVLNLAGIVQQAGTTKTVAGTFTIIGTGIYSLNGGTGNSLVLNGPLVCTGAGFFQSLNNNFTINNTVTGNLRFGPTVSEWTLNNFTMGSGSGNVTLGTPMEIGAAGALNLNGGNITTSAVNSLTVNNTAAAAITRTAGFVNGPLIRAMTAAGAYLFPTGNAGQYLPLTLTNPGAVSVAVSAFSANPGASAGIGFTNPSTTEYWLTNVTAGAWGAGASVTLQRPTNFLANAVIGRRDAGTSTGVYNSAGPASFAGGMNVITSSVLSSPAAPMFFTTGDGLQPPTNLTFSAITNTSFTASFTAATPAPIGYLVVRRLASAPPTSPTNGVMVPSVGSSLGSGIIISNSAVTAGISAIGLVAGTEYALDIYSYFGSVASPTYVTTQVLTGSVTTTGGPNCATIAPPTTVNVNLLERSINFTGVSLTGAGVLLGSGTNLVYASPSGSITLAYNYAGVGAPPTYCPGCITQIYVGLNSSPTTNVFRDCWNGFAYNTTGGQPGVTFTAPATPGVYYINVTGTWDYSCQPVNFGTNYVAANTIGIVIVGTPPCIDQSDIVALGFVPNTAIPYISQTGPTVLGSMTNLWNFRLRDGGTTTIPMTDGDNYPTVLQQITITISNPAPLNRIALFDASGMVKLDEQPAAGTVTFTIPAALRPAYATTADNNSIDFFLKGSYQTTVTDNAQFNFSITNAVTEAFTPAAPRSGLLNPAALVGPSGNSGIAVVADRPSWLTGLGAVQPTTVGLAPLQITPDVAVAAVDANGNKDVDYVGTVQLIAPAALVGSPMVNAVAGEATFSGVNAAKLSTSGTTQLTAQLGALTALSNTFTVQAPLLTITPSAVNFGTIAVGEVVEQMFTLSGSTLPSNGLVQIAAAHPHVSISALGGGAFSTVGTIALTPTPLAPSSPNGSTLSQTFFVRYAPSTNIPMSSIVSAGFSGSVAAPATLIGQSMATSITTVPAASANLNFGTVFVGATADQFFSTAAVNISGALTLSASAGVSLSTTGTAPFSPTITIYPSSNQITPQVITARFAPTVFGITSIGTITLTNPYTTATVLVWQGTGANSVPVALGFASSLETSSTATGGVPGAIQDGVPITVQGATFRADGVIASTSNATVQVQMSALPGGVATFSLTGGAGTLVSASRITLPNIGITWTNAPLAGGTTQAIISLVRTGGDALQSTQALVTISKGPTIPSISSVNPMIIGSGSSVRISGTNFFGSTTVTFGGFPASSFVINSPTLITAIVGTSGGSGDVEVRAPGGIGRTRTAGNGTDTVQFFGIPTITDFNPKEAKEGDVVSIVGTNFDPSAVTSFGGNAAQSSTVNNSTQINAVVSSNGDNGLLTVRAVGGSTSATVPFSFVRPPDILGVATLYGTLGTEIVVTGANFKALREVWLGPVQITLATVSLISENELRFRVPVAVSGAITVRNSAGVDASDQIFTYVYPPQITSMTPDSGSVGLQVTIRGQNFIGVTSLTVSGAEAIRTLVVSTTQIIAVLGRGETGTNPIIIQTIGGVTASTVLFTYINPPIISGFLPTIGGQRTMLTITGANFSAIDRVTVGGLDVISFEVLSTTQIVAIVSESGGSGFIRVFNRLGGAFSGSQFTFFPPPFIESFDPLEGSTGSTITIKGANFVNSSTTVVTVGGVPVAEFSVESPTQIVAVVSTAATGRVGIRTGGGFIESSALFRFLPPKFIPPPRITSFAPDSASEGEIITVEGLNFINVRRVRLSGITIASYTVNSPTSLTFLMPNITSGTIEIETTTGTATARRVLAAIPPRVQLTPLQRDSIALVQIYNATSGEDWTRRRNWLSAKPLADWQGVTVENSRVTQLALDSTGLSGALPLTVSTLTALRSFKASANALEGAFPAGLLLLPNLQELILSQNQLTGQLPSGIGSMSGLATLRLNGNRFSGQIPADICSLLGLREINLANNQLQGTLPTCFAQIPVLEILDLSNNRFIGGIPSEFAGLARLRELLLNNNALTEPLPRTIWASTNLIAEGGAKDRAQLTATGLRSLVRFNISNNQISGEIPTEIVNTTTLQEFSAVGNQLRGTIPSTLGALTNLRVLDVARNLLTGQLPSSVRDLRLAERFVVSRNSLSGVLPAEIAQMVSVRELALDSNAFSGGAPDALAGLGRLQILRLNGNLLTSIPNLSGISTMTILAVENNRLQFEPLETNVRTGNTSFTFTYAPQDSVGEARDTAAAIGLPFTLSARMRSEQNRYQWLKNGRDIGGATTLALTFPAFTRLDTGLYNVRVLNTALRGLALVTRAVRVRASVAPVPESAPLLLTPEEQARNTSLNAALEWLSALGATAYDVQIATDEAFTSKVLDSTVTGTRLQIAAGTLRSFTVYAWRVRARNESGTSAWSSSRRFTTIDAGALVLIPTTDIGRSVVGRTRGGNVEITSVSDVPLRLVGARLEGADIASFRIDTSTAPVRDVTIPAFGTYLVRINFSPSSLGVKQARLVLSISNGNAITERNGVIRGTPTFVEVNNLTFDTVLASFTAVRNLAVQNFGRDTIRIKDNIRIFTSSNSLDTSAIFKLDPSAPQAPYSIRPNETLYVPVQATTSRLGETSATARIITTQDTIFVGMQASVRAIGKFDVLLRVGIEASTTAAVPGTKVQLRLFRAGNLSSIADINRVANPPYTMNIRMNRNVLVPSPTESKLIPQTTPNIYRVEQTQMDLVTDTTKILTFDCIAVAGDTTTTAIEILDPVWNSKSIFLTSPLNGVFTSKASRAGGLRLITPVASPVQLPGLITSLTPNPANTETTIGYTLLNTESVEIALFDARGAKIRTLLSTAEQQAGEYTLTLRTSDLASGQYRIMLTAPSGMLQKQLNVVR